MAKIHRRQRVAEREGSSASPETVAHEAELQLSRADANLPRGIQRTASEYSRMRPMQIRQTAFGRAVAAELEVLRGDIGQAREDYDGHLAALHEVFVGRVETFNSVRRYIRAEVAISALDGLLRRIERSAKAEASLMSAPANRFSSNGGFAFDVITRFPEAPGVLNECQEALKDLPEALDLLKLDSGSTVNFRRMRRKVGDTGRRVTQKLDQITTAVRGVFTELRRKVGNACSSGYCLNRETATEFDRALSTQIHEMQFNDFNLAEFLNGDRLQVLYDAAVAFRDNLKRPESVRGHDDFDRGRQSRVQRTAAHEGDRLVSDWNSSDERAILGFADSLVDESAPLSAQLIERAVGLGRERVLEILDRFLAEISDIPKLKTAVSSWFEKREAKGESRNEEEEGADQEAQDPELVEQIEYNLMVIEEAGLAEIEGAEQLAKTLSNSRLEHVLDEVRAIDPNNWRAIVEQNPAILELEYPRKDLARRVQAILAGSTGLEGYLIFDPGKFPHHFCSLEVVERTQTALGLLQETIVAVAGENEMDLGALGLAGLRPPDIGQTSDAPLDEEQRREEEIEQLLNRLNSCGLDGEACLAVVRYGFYYGGSLFVGGHRLNKEYIVGNVERGVDNFQAERKRLVKAKRVLTSLGAIDIQGGASLNPGMDELTEKHQAVRAAVLWVIENEGYNGKMRI